MSYDINTVAELVDALAPSQAELGESFGIGQSAVGNWVSRNEIPPQWHVRLMVRARLRGVSVNPTIFGLSEEEAAVLGFFRGAVSRSTLAVASA